MAHVLAMAAIKLRYPVLFVVPMKACNPSLQLSRPLLSEIEFRRSAVALDICASSRNVQAEAARESAFLGDYCALSLEADCNPALARFVNGDVVTERQRRFDLAVVDVPVGRRAYPRSV
jgi:hypothetical protein